MPTSRKEMLRHSNRIERKSFPQGLHHKRCSHLQVHHQNGSLTDRSDVLAKFHVQSNLGPTSNTSHPSAAHEHLVRALSWLFTSYNSPTEANVPSVNTSTKVWSFRARLAMNLTNANSLCSPWNSWIIILLICDFTHLIGSSSSQNLAWCLPVASPALEDCKISEEFRQ